MVLKQELNTKMHFSIEFANSISFRLKFVRFLHKEYDWKFEGVSEKVALKIWKMGLGMDMEKTWSLSLFIHLMIPKTLVGHCLKNKF